MPCALWPLPAVPEYMLCLQNGKFDAPDRIFHNIQATWQNVLTNPSDVKEVRQQAMTAACC